MLKKAIILFLFSAVLACSKSDNPDPISNSDRGVILSDIGKNVIVPSFEAFESTTKTLAANADAYIADAKNEQKLIGLRESWIAAASAWKRSILFSQGPVETDFLATAVYFNSLNTSGIEKSVSQTTIPIDNAYIETLGAAFKGLPAIEYLIFDKQAGNAGIIGNYTGINAARRGLYLKALCQNLNNQATVIANKWKSGGDNYVAKFSAADGNDINSSLGMLSNKMIDLIYTIKDERIGAALGKRNNGTPQPDLVDAKISDASLALLKSELLSLESAFTGKGVAGAEGKGVDDMLDQVKAMSGSELLSTKIKNQFAVVYAKQAQITVPLSAAVTTQKEIVSALYDEVKKLQVMMEVDMINNLGVLLTFSDNDGD